MRREEEENGNVGERKPKLIFNCGRVRSKEEEEALDKKIAEIRRKNQLIERRKELVEEDRMNFLNKYDKTVIYDGTKRIANTDGQALKTKKHGGWDREWDAGKTSTENWRENVPDIDSNRQPNLHFMRQLSKNRNNYVRCNNNNVKSKNVLEINAKNQKFKGIGCTETNKKTLFPNKKRFDVKNSKNLKYSESGKDGTEAAVLRNSHRMETLGGLKQSHVSVNEESSSQSTGTYSSSESSTKRYSDQRVPLITPSGSDEMLTQHLDVIKLDISMAEIKTDVAEMITESNNNNNIGKVDNNLQKLSTVAVGSAPLSTTLTSTITKEYGDSNSESAVMDDIEKMMERLLL
ncbi:unnamed protein product [Litomosoides sigmodontis]|uniref:Uncharacterized protein n=1 Tax=Litomosoides sigmodontis TaxID=42156 RepID=A0A3P6TVP2_LITSI|nr:unnamed protein product [Litomosoides sigmodontis]